MAYIIKTHPIASIAPGGAIFFTSSNIAANCGSHWGSSGFEVEDSTESMTTSWDSSVALVGSLAGCSVVVPETTGEATRDGFALGSLLAVSLALRRRSSSSLAALSCSAFANAAFWEQRDIRDQKQG